MKLNSQFRLELFARVVVILGVAHDADHRVDRVERRQQRHQPVQLAQQLGALVLEPLRDDLEPERDEPVDDLAQVELARHAVGDHGQVDADRDPQAGVPHQVGDQLRHVATALAADLHPQAVAVGEVLRHLGDVGDLLGAGRAHHLGHDLVGRDAVRQLGHDDRLQVPGQLLDVVLALQPERALAARVGVGQLLGVDHDAAGREVGARA